MGNSLGGKEYTPIMELDMSSLFKAIVDDEIVGEHKADSIIFNGKSLVKIITTNREDKHMEEVGESLCQESRKSLAQEYVEKQESLETRMLKEAEVINESGVITQRGALLMCQILLENQEVKQRIIEYLQHDE